MRTEKIDIKKIIYGLIDYIMELESFRPPLSIVNTIYSNLILSKSKNRTYFIMKHPELHEKIQKELDPYFKKVVKVTLKDLILLFSGILLISLSGAIFAIIVTNDLLKSIFGVIIALSSIYFLFWIYISHKRAAGEKYDEKIKKAVQELIDYEIELIKENHLDPTEYPIKLKHTDYHSLRYKTKNNYYMSYLKK